MHHVHTGEAVVTSEKIDISLLVTTRLIAHSGQSEFFPNCVGEFGMDTGQPLVTSNECQITCVITTRHVTLISECTYKSIYIIIYVAYWHWGEFLVNIKMHLFCYQKDCTRSRSVSVHSYLTYDESPAHGIHRGDK